MAKVLAIFLFSLSAFLLSACSNNSLSFKSVDGKQLNFKDYQGKFIVLNYWSPTCEPCVHEIKALNAFYKQYHHEAVVIGIDYDNPPANKLKKLVEQFNIHYPVIIDDPAKVLQLGHVNYLPMTYILNAKGRVLASMVGPQTQKTLATKLASLKRS
jgi:thiol-disulfide isomerase/thioredoxin